MTSEEILQQEQLIIKAEKVLEKIPNLDFDGNKKQPIRHHSSGSYRRPSPKLNPLSIELSPRPISYSE